ncbi:hypothetical protein FA95DRAFT_359409 [Auriscalpium vulgare]|uniref:Uncharacterized protein n=1 Tax=Auriscalpium vulgare TaxID=40419 RepID=A0ACB8S480_9AGAM|nr:hypothetical protein FA95DRAFT_359409 [Auriscalpium vulgare]
MMKTPDCQRSLWPARSRRQTLSRTLQKSLNKKTTKRRSLPLARRLRTAPHPQCHFARSYSRARQCLVSHASRAVRSRCRHAPISVFLCWLLVECTFNCLLSCIWSVSYSLLLSDAVLFCKMRPTNVSSRLCAEYFISVLCVQLSSEQWMLLIYIGMTFCLDTPGESPERSSGESCLISSFHLIRPPRRLSTHSFLF